MNRDTREEQSTLYAWWLLEKPVARTKKKRKASVGSGTRAFAILGKIAVSFALRGLLRTPRSLSTVWNSASLEQEALMSVKTLKGERQGVQPKVPVTRFPSEYSSLASCKVVGSNPHSCGFAVRR